MRGIKKLHYLIQALSKTEKRYISIELSKQKSKKGEIDLILFDILKKQETIHEDKIKSIPEFNTTLKLIIRSKYLFDFILRCLIDYYHSREIEIAIGNHIRIIKIFILKGLHEYTHYHLNKAQKLAEKFEDLYRLGILCTLRKLIVARSSGSHTEFFKEMLKIEQQENSVHERIINLNSYNNYLNHISVALKKNSGSKLDKETQQILDSTASSHLFINEKNALTKKARIIFHEVNAIYNERVMRDYRSALIHTEKQMELIENLEAYQKTNPPSYITCLKHYCIFAAETRQFPKAKDALQRLKVLYKDKSTSKNIFEKSLIFLSQIEAETRLTLIDHKVDRLDSTQAKVIEEIELFDKMFDGESKMIIYFNLTLRLILIGDYKNAFRWLEKILHEHQGMRLDILQDAHVLSLLCIYEIDSVNLFQSRERSYLRHYQLHPSSTVEGQEKSKPAHTKIIHLLAKVYQFKNNAEIVRKNLEELESYIAEEIKKNDIDNLLGETMLVWIRKKI
jgi:tetratricopeptide (TPR) repeat protein